MVNATKKGSTAKFTDGIWKTGIPQKAGWAAIDGTEVERILPKSIVDMSEIRKEEIAEVVPKPKKKSVAEKSDEVKPKRKSRKKKDDNPEQEIPS